MSQPSAELGSFYRRYLSQCNEHRFADLGEFIADDVQVNGQVQGLRCYVDGLQAVVRAFPDYHWDLRHLLIDGSWLAAHFIDTGTHRGEFLNAAATGRRVSTQEFALYRIDEGKIVEIWVSADNLSLLHQLQNGTPPAARRSA
jgi:aspartyl-tRNA synthetase